MNRNVFINDHLSIKEVFRYTVKVTATRMNGNFVDGYDGMNKLQFNVCEVKKKCKIQIGDWCTFTGKWEKNKHNLYALHCSSYEVVLKSPCPLQQPFKYSDNRSKAHTSDQILSIYINREKIIKRSEFIRNIRDWLNKSNFIEVETPIICKNFSGAFAEPFITKRNTGETAYLRIAPELNLKKFVMAGYNRVYEIAKVFRNEGISVNHNPEFTLMELYEQGITVSDLMKYVEHISSFLFKSTGAWPSYTLKEAIEAIAKQVNVNNMDVYDMNYIKELFELLAQRKMFSRDAREYQNLEKINDPLYYHLFLAELFVEHNADKIPFVHIKNHPSSLSPFAKPYPDDPSTAQRFESFIYGVEVANGYQELNDHVLQRKNMEKYGGNSEFDKDLEYCSQMEKYSLPETCGLGVGIDRMVSLFYKTSIHNVILK